MVFYDITNEVGNIHMGGNKMKMKKSFIRKLVKLFIKYSLVYHIAVC